MMQGNITPDDPPPGNPSSMPGWNSQWSLEHQQFYYVNTSTGERRWYLPTVITPPPIVQAKPEPPVVAPVQKIQRKAVGAQSVRSNQRSPASTSPAQNIQANTGSVRAPLPQAMDSYFPPSTVPGQYQAPQVAQPLTPPAQYQSAQSPQTTQAVPSSYQQLDFSGHFASLSLEHSQPGSANITSELPKQYQLPPAVQSHPDPTETPISPVSNQPNAHNFSSQPSSVCFPPPPAPVQYQSLPTPQSPDQSALTGNNFASPDTLPNVAGSLLIAPQPVLRRVPPPPPPRNPVQYQTQHVPGQNFASPVSGSRYSPNPNYPTPHSATSPPPVSYQQQPVTQQYGPVTIPGAYQPIQQQQTSVPQQYASFQQHPPPPAPGGFQQVQQISGYQQTASPVQQQYNSPTQSPAGGQYAFPPPPPAPQQQQKGPEALQQVSQSVQQPNSNPVQNQDQGISLRHTSTQIQTTAFPPPPSTQEQQHQQPYDPSPPTQYIPPQSALPDQTPKAQHYSTTNPTPPPLQHYPTAPIPVQGPYQPPPQSNPPPSAPPLQRYSSAPEVVSHQQASIAAQSQYRPPGPVKNPYAQQVAHANSFFGPPPRRSQAQNQSQKWPQTQAAYQQPQNPYGPQAVQQPQHQQQQTYGQPQGQPPAQYQVQNQAQFQQPGQYQHQPSFPPHQLPQQYQQQYQQPLPQAQSQPHQTQAQPEYQTQTQTQPLLPPRKPSTGMMGKMSSKLTSYSKTATDKTKRFSVSQPGLKKWGYQSRDAVSDGSLFDAAGAGGGGGDFSGGGFSGGGDLGGGEGFSGGGGDFSGGDFSGGDFGGGGDSGGGDFGGGEDFSGGGGDFSGGDFGGDMGGGESAVDAQTAVDANAAQLAIEQQGRENALMLLDPVGTVYETVPDTGVNSLI
ncbi:hypothetical protein BKA61DRAFT_651712 [Leptodontidium sp. MPI-SDFR-AT-0119]|nr:hypothetical protein BKA61DRAFT_651712 [Leptodontidium sp. MPI-SDFR-AT-0119]